MAASVLFGIGLIISPDGGGFFSGLGKALGLLLIAAGNLLSWLLNLISWRLGRNRWLTMVLAVQGLPAILFAGWLATLGLEALQEDRASTQRAAIHDAIQTDDVVALQQAQQNCGQRCQESISLYRQLLNAARHGAHSVARHLLAQGAAPYRAGTGSPAYHDGHTSLYTCEGSYLVSLNALEVAVARQDMALVNILWPASDASARSAALWTAAELDRLDMVQWMVEAGEPMERNGFRGQRETLLRAAASGAALQVGSWVMQTLPIAMPPQELQAAMEELIDFMLEINSPRSIEFGHMLKQQGADINAPGLNGKTPLERAVDFRSRTMAAQLIQLGADPSILPQEDAMALQALLQKPERPNYGRNRPDCVAP